MSVAGHHLPIWFDEATGPDDGDVSVWNSATGRFESAPVVGGAIPEGTFVQASKTIATEGPTVTTALETVTHPTRAPWHDYTYASGPQADGSYDHVRAMGWNAGAFIPGPGGVGNLGVAGQPAMLMGFEDGWYDGTNMGPEWWVGHYSADQSVALFRPFYTRVLSNTFATTVAAGSNGVNTSTFAGAGTLNVASAANLTAAGKVTVVTGGTPAVISYTDKTATTLTGCTTVSGGGVLATGGTVTGYAKRSATYLDIGDDGNGAFTVSRGGFTGLFTVTDTILTFKPKTGSSAFFILDGLTSYLSFKCGGVQSFQLKGVAATVLAMIDKDGRNHAVYTQGASNTASNTELFSPLHVYGGLTVDAGQAATIFTVAPTIITFKPTTGSSAFLVLDGLNSYLSFKVAGAQGFQLQGVATTVQAMINKDGANHVVYTYGASSAAADTQFLSKIRTPVGLGVWGHAAPAAQPAAPVTLADVIAVLQAYGLAA